MGKSSLTNAYLVLYNLSCCAGWAYLLVLAVGHLAEEQSSEGIWAVIGPTLKAVQGAAVLEVAHAVLRLVKTPVATTSIQVFARIYVVWWVLDVGPPVHDSLFLALTVLSWCAVEVPRYSYYALSILDIVPYPLFWLRYSLFAVLYPTGITGELGSTWAAVQYLYENPQLYSVAPLPAVPSLRLHLWHLQVLMAALYLPLAPKMYTHMATQRRNQMENRGTAGGKRK